MHHASWRIQAEQIHDRLPELMPFYRDWAVNHMAGDEDDVGAFCHFLMTEPGRFLRLEGVIWLDAALAQSERFYRGTTGNNIAKAMDVILSQHASELIVNSASREAMIAIVARLVRGQVATAMGPQQRIGGFIPNFYSTYDWNAPPMGAKQKFKLSLRALIDPVSFLTTAGIAGAEQYKGIFPAYGSGIEGYGKRYGAAFANHASSTLLGRAVYPAIFHQDPRYFYKGKGSIRSRALYAISAAVIARGDDGRWKPNYSRVLGNFSAAAISNLYYPASDRGASLVVLNGLAGTGADAVANLIREFVLKGITSHVPKGANGQP